MDSTPTWALAAVFLLTLFTLWWHSTKKAAGPSLTGWREAHRVFIRRSASLVGVPTGDRGRLWLSVLRMMFDPLFDRVFYIYWFYVAVLTFLVLGSVKLGWFDWLDTERFRLLCIMVGGLIFLFHFYPRWLDRRTEKIRKRGLDNRIARAEAGMTDTYRNLALEEEEPCPPPENKRGES